ncbi:low temperature requirement protein A [Agarilytica rhodophyticola]|uniref:low temperature requirement protein A n=1 Tax=Agarilytica rhodophyticola TaxID=1737490 RepID=UPI000B3446D9|nr:low temperature requirement protein A [Agarilytica rhodophyticola]
MKTSPLQYHVENRHATWLELFFDLVFVASIGIVTHNLAHTHDGHIEFKQFWLFPVEFIPVWWIWATHTLYANRFDTDSRQHRMISLLIMFLLVTMSAFLGEALFDHYDRFIIFYTGIRIILAILYFSSENKLDDSSKFAIVIGWRTIAGAVISGTSLFAEEPYRYVLLIGGIVFEMVISSAIGTKLVDTDPIHREHLVERIGLLTIILLGESVISLVNSLQGTSWNLENTIASASGFLIIGTIWWIYFDNFDVLERLKSLKHGFLLIYSHLLLAMGLVILANLIRHAILSDLGMHDFRLLSIIGMVLFYLGLHTVFFEALPTFRMNLILNSVVPIGITTVSTFLPTPTHALLGMLFGLLVYSFMGLRLTGTKNIDCYLETK